MSEPRSLDSPPADFTLHGDEDDPLLDEERGTRPTGTLSILNSVGQSSTSTDETELRTRAGSAVSASASFIKRKTSQLIGAMTPTSRGDTPISPKLAELVEAFRTSDIAAGLATETTEAANAAAPHSDDALPDVALESSLTRGRKGASWGTQFQILSGRAFKNLYRDPALLTAHYVSSVALAGKFVIFAPSGLYSAMVLVICGIFFSRSGYVIFDLQAGHDLTTIQ